MKKFIYFLIFILFFSSIFTSCSNSELSNSNTYDESNELNFSKGLNISTDLIQTMTTSSNKENDLHDYTNETSESLVDETETYATNCPLAENSKYDVNFDLIEFFYGIWNSGASDESSEVYMIGVNSDYHVMDYIDTHGIITGLYKQDNSLFLICTNNMSECFKLSINFNNPDVAYYFDCYCENNIPNYKPVILTRIANAKPYSLSGEINGFIRSILWNEYDFFQPYPYVEIVDEEQCYTNDYMYIEENETMYILNSYSDNTISFTSNFVEIDDVTLSNIGDKVYVITFDMIKTTQGNWCLGNWHFK